MTQVGLHKNFHNHLWMEKLGYHSSDKLVNFPSLITLGGLLLTLNNVQTNI